MAPEHPSSPSPPSRFTDPALLGFEADALVESRALRLSRNIRNSEVALTEFTFNQLLETLCGREVLASIQTEGLTRIQGRLNTLGSDFLGVVDQNGIECLIVLDRILSLSVDENQDSGSPGKPAQLAGSLVRYIDARIPLGTRLFVSVGPSGRSQALEFLGTTRDCIVFTSAPAKGKVYIRAHAINEIRQATES